MNADWVPPGGAGPAPAGTRIMGVLNVTPDSFSDGGRYFEVGKAIEHGLSLARAGADIIDVGGESTRPGAARVEEDEELRRVVPVVRELAEQGLVISVDTMRVRVAEAALEAGAAIINDVSAGQAEAGMLGLAAQAQAPIVLMHWRGHSAGMQQRAVYQDVVAEVLAELRQRVQAAVGAGVAESQIILDPGIGFAKTAEHNWRLLAAQEALAGLGYKVLIAASRKRFLRTLVSPSAPDEAAEPELDQATAALTAFAVARGAWAVRVHDPRSSRIAADVAAALAAHAPADVPLRLEEE
ncbi:dihydropteroate synthase [Sediminivirga luteola]|uniref:Dihydropteroate synthase n=1 Tax=Sediminivirga luteola TaxID=1774748 RepID=A0A8J2XJH5_9MICO|nr:dihydropteroate synthase [Sediminivirga luteola]GGA01853.1 dihydropteroate synthase [Sediminivirga luteola]